MATGSGSHREVVSVMTEIQGDLFESSESLAHCVSRDLHMGKGIATVFKTKFGGIEELKKQCAGVGEMAVLEREHRYIYYLVTKERYFEKPTLQTLKSSLTAVKNHCQRHNVTALSMPRIGCGLDRLEWREVSRVIEEVFKYTNVIVTVYTPGS